MTPIKPNMQNHNFIHPGDMWRYKLFLQYFKDKKDIADGLKMNSIIEIGVRTGYSALAFLTSHPKASYIGYDNCSECNAAQIEWAKTLLSKFNAKIVIADTQKLNSLKERADFIHVDGDHTEKGADHDLHLAIQALNPGGTVLIDDYDYIPTVRKAVDKFLKDHPNLKSRYIKTLRGDIVIQL